MAMADMAAQTSEIPMSLLAISERQNISLSYLEQLFNRLRRAELVSSVRGPRGGYLLARPAERIVVSQIMDAVAEPVSVTRCDGDADQGCHGSERCITHNLWSELDRHITEFLASVSLADVVARSLCNDNAPALTQLALKAERAAESPAAKLKAGRS